MLHERNPATVCADSARRRIAWLTRELERDDVRAVPSLQRAYGTELERLATAFPSSSATAHRSEAAAFAELWQAIARACEHGLANEAYPDDRRPALYELLGAARECAEPDSLDRVRGS